MCGYHSVRYTGIIHKSQQMLDDFIHQSKILPSTHFSATKTAPAQAVATGVPVTDVLYTKCYILFILLLDILLIILKLNIT